MCLQKKINQKHISLKRRGGLLACSVLACYACFASCQSVLMLWRRNGGVEVALPRRAAENGVSLRATTTRQDCDVLYVVCGIRKQWAAIICYLKLEEKQMQIFRNLRGNFTYEQVMGSSDDEIICIVTGMTKGCDWHAFPFFNKRCSSHMENTRYQSCCITCHAWGTHPKSNSMVAWWDHCFVKAMVQGSLEKCLH